MERLTELVDGVYRPTPKGSEYLQPDDGSNAARLLQIVGKYEAEKRIIEAEADAEVVRIAAKAEAMATVAKIVELARTVGFNVTENETGYLIEFDDVHTEQMFKEVVKQYLEYLAYLEKWNGELPEVVAGDDAVSIIIPNGN